LSAAVYGLPPARRLAIVLRYDAELPVCEIAVLLGRSAPAVREMIDDALERVGQSVSSTP
jgi:DNA-directed RNA polymerase specialized sigma24 family protein